MTIVGAQGGKNEQCKQEREERIITNFHSIMVTTNTHTLLCYTTHTAKGMINVHTTHFLKYKWDLSRNTKIPSNKLFLQVTENELILTMKNFMMVS